MTRSLLFWIIMLLSLCLGLWGDYVPGQPYPFVRGVRNFLIFILMGILGWQVFGAAIK